MWDLSKSFIDNQLHIWGIHLWGARTTALAIITAYLIGSLSPGIIISRFMGKGDIRQHGSHGTGATNIQRTLGTFPAIVVFLCDMLKGVFALWIVSLIFEPSFEPSFDPWYFCAIAAILGHIFPIYYKFRGGKGVATTFAILLLFDWKSALMAFGLFLIVAFTTRYISLGSILGVITFAIIQITKQDQKMILYACVIVLIVIATHKSNIKRLLSGKENKFSLKRRKEK